MESAATMEFLPGLAAPGVSRDFLVVSIHDVAPSNRELVDKVVAALGHRGVRICSLLVVPDYHHQGLFTKDREFVSWLRDLELDGLDYDEALRRITTARDEFRAHGLKPRGFVAPAWLLSAEAERAARDAGMEYTTRLRTVSDLRSGREFAARSIVYSIRNRWRCAVSRAWNAALFRVLRSNSLLRMSIHPPDCSHPAIWRQIVNLIDATIGSRTATTYQDWIAEQRSGRGS